MPTIGSGRIGPRTWRVDIEEAVESIGESGAPITTWQTLMTVNAQREAMTGDERLIADQIAARQYVQWSMPFDARIDPDTVDVPADRRLRFKGRTFDIVRARRIGDLGATIELVTLTSSTADQPARVH